jgi:DNA-binding transcriptional MerR regulator
MAPAARYGIDELADLGGVSRRTVRYYVQEALLPPPLGVGRGHHYGPQHLEALLRVKALQEAGRTLGEIRAALSGRKGRAAAPSLPAPPPRTLWRRFTLAPGVELHVSGEAALPSAAGLEQLADWCRVHLGRGREDDDGHA